MGYAHWLAPQILDVVRTNRSWMAWNLTLATIPAILAVWLFARPHRRNLAWMAGAVVFVLFLPNAPYVVTDLIHLRWNAAELQSDDALVFGLLPLFALFVTVGFGSYLVCLELMVREVRDVRPATQRWTIELAAHVTCALGIVLGRVARLNTWDTVQDPRWTTERVFNTLTWRGAPVAFFLILFAVWFTTFALRALGRSVTESFRRLAARRGPRSQPTAV